jgi:coenzyme F420 hydrogenase subunit beta
MDKCANKYTEYCSACGLCQGKGKAKLDLVDGLLQPTFLSDDKSFFDKVCPISGSAYEIQPEWGNYISVMVGHSTDSEVRYNASSGGVITAIATYLLDKKLIDGVIHTGKDESKPWRTRTYCSTSIADINARCGSRYSQSMPLADIFDLTQEGKKYIYIGKPCDVLALHNYFKVEPEFKKRFLCTISFFCAGAPSENAQMKLLGALNCKPEDCADLRYRGNGWPGFATAVRKDGSDSHMTYDESWGKILGRDIRKSCKFCMNGTGEPADISCGDAWYSKEDGSPDFSEGDGRNIIFTRSEAGDKILKEALKHGYVSALDYSSEIDKFKNIQKFQYERKATMLEKCLALKVMFRTAPSYSYKSLTEVAGKAKDISVKRKLVIFLGTIKRIAKGKI